MPADVLYEDQVILCYRFLLNLLKNILKVRRNIKHYRRLWR